MSDRTVCVVGRGIAGLAAAFELRKGGFSVRVVGPARGDEPAGVGTRAAAGVSTLKGAILPQKPLFTAKKAGHELLPAWLSEVERIAGGTPIPKLFTGVSELFFDLTGYEGIRQRVFHRKFTGVYRSEVLDFEELNRRAGDLRQLGITARGGFFYPRDGWFDPEAALAVLERAVRNLGAEISDDSVEAIVEHPAIGLEIRGKKAIYRADECLVAAGVWTDRLLMASGVAGLAPQSAFSGETLRGDAPEGLASPVVTTFAKASLVAIDGRLQFGSTCYAASSLYSGSDPAAVAGLRAKIAARSPSLSFSEVVFGLRARAPDRLPTLGPLLFPSRNRRLWVCTGLYKNGLQLAPLFARDLVRFLRNDAHIGPFLPTR